MLLCIICNFIVEPPCNEDEEMGIVDQKDNGDHCDDTDKEDTQIDVALTFLDIGQYAAFEILQLQSQGFDQPKSFLKILVLDHRQVHVLAIIDIAQLPQLQWQCFWFKSSFAFRLGNSFMQQFYFQYTINYIIILNKKQSFRH